MFPRRPRDVGVASQSKESLKNLLPSVINRSKLVRASAHQPAARTGQMRVPHSLRRF